MARPQLQEEEKRIIQVNIRLTKEENEKVLTYAEASGLSPANWIRQKAFTGRFPAIKISPVDANLYRELNKIGVNLNQAIRKINSGVIPAVFYSILTKLVDTQQAILKALMK